MSNITLNPLWLTAMPAYEHAVGVGTLLYSSLAFYLMINKTPKIAQPFTKYLMMLQAAITLVDINYGFLFCPVTLLPAPGGLCYGIICSWFGWSGQVGNTLLICSMLFGVACVLYCFHYKYVSIGQMTGGDSHKNHRHAVFRIVIALIYAVPVAVDLGRHRQFVDGSLYVKINFPSLHYLFESPGYPSFSYDPTFCPVLRQLYFVSTLFNIWLAAAIVTYFAVSSFARLSKQTIPPLVIQLAPILVYLASYFLFNSNPNISNTLIGFQLTHSFVHTSILILSTPSYREPFIFWQKKKSSVASLYTPR